MESGGRKGLVSAVLVKYTREEKQRLLEPYNDAEISRFEEWLFDAGEVKHFSHEVVGAHLTCCELIRNGVGYVAVIQVVQTLSSGQDHKSVGAPEDPLLVFNEVAFPHVVAALRNRGRTIGIMDFADWKKAVFESGR